MEAIERQGRMGRQFECEDQDETREVIRRYLPMREYDEIEANGRTFFCKAEVEACGNHGSDLCVSNNMGISVFIGEQKHYIPMCFLMSRISSTGASWRELIEREICRQALALPGWKNEYKED